MAIVTAGLHHVTAIAGRAQANIEYYVRLLGLRLVKRTVNFDDPLTYHLYYGDALGNPGSILSFFPWAGAGPAVRGSGEATELALRVPPGALPFWRALLSDHGQAYEDGEVGGAALVRFSDPDGTPLAFVEGVVPPPPAAPGAAGFDLLRPTRVWTGSNIDAEHAVVGLDSVTVNVTEPAAAADLLAGTFGFDVTTTDATGRTRVSVPGAGLGASLDLVSSTTADAGRLGTGSLHHVALRVPDRDALEAARDELLTAGHHPTRVKDRVYFASVYVRVPSGLILELATDGPGFTVDEPPDELGLALRLPAWLEQERSFLRAQLPVTASPEYADRFG